MPEEKCILDPNLDCIGKAAAALLEKRVTDLEEDQKKQAGWIALLKLTKEVLETCIDVLGFSAPDRM